MTHSFFKSVLLIFGLFLLGCEQSIDEPPESEINSAKFDWLLGKWEKTEENSINQTFETWTKENDSSYRGHGIVVAGGDTIWQEHMLFHMENELWKMIIKTPENQDQVSFNLTSFDSTSFIVENPTHDFPKIISYSRASDELCALVKNDTMSIYFDFHQVSK